MSDHYDDAALEAAMTAVREHGEWSEKWTPEAPRCIAGDVLEAVAPLIAAKAKADAWDEGYAVASDDFTHSDYCGRKCQCEGIHGQTNPYRSDERGRS